MNYMLHMTVEEFSDGDAEAVVLIVDRSTDLPTRRERKILDSTEAAFHWCGKHAADVLGVVSVRPEWVPDDEPRMWRADIRPNFN